VTTNFILAVSPGKLTWTEFPVEPPMIFPFSIFQFLTVPAGAVKVKDEPVEHRESFPVIGGALNGFTIMV
jgi:hypothetical protein